MSTIRIVFWRTFERAFLLFGRVHRLDPKDEYLFLIAKRRYLGRPFEVDGIRVRRFDKVIELHINNHMVMRLLREEHSFVAASVKLLFEARRSLPILADYVTGPKFGKIQVIYGITFIHRGIKRLGFQSLPMHESLLTKVTTWHLKNLFRFVNPEADHSMENHQNDLVPKMVVMTKSELFQRWASVQPEEAALRRTVVDSGIKKDLSTEEVKV